MQQFPTAAQLSSGAGLCPTNHESASVKKSVRTERGNVWLKTTLTQSVSAATNRGSRLQFPPSRAESPLENKHAIVALGHTLLKKFTLSCRRNDPHREEALAPESSRDQERAQHHLRCLKKVRLQHIRR